MLFCFSSFGQCNLSQSHCCLLMVSFASQGKAGTRWGQSSCCAIDCPDSLRLRGHFFGNFFSLFSPSPSILVAVGRLGEQLCPAWCCSHIWARAQPWERQCWEEYQPSSTFCSVNNGCYKPESCRARLKPAAAGGEALVCSRLGSAWDGKSQRELAGK